MRPLGLEGKVGAPAIVREKPLERIFSELTACCTVRTWSSDAVRQLLGSALPFQWQDVLESVQALYAYVNGKSVSASYRREANIRLSHVLGEAAGLVPERVLHYDLATPALSLSPKECGKRREGLVLSISGELEYVSCASSFLLVRGEVESVRADSASVAVIRGAVGFLDLLHSVAIYSPILQASPAWCDWPVPGLYANVPMSAAFIIVDHSDACAVYGHPVLGIQRGPGSFIYSTRFNPLTQQLRDKAISLSEDQERAVEELPGFCSELDAAYTSLHTNLSYRINHPVRTQRTSDITYPRYCLDVPSRGASR